MVSMALMVQVILFILQMLLIGLLIPQVQAMHFAEDLLLDYQKITVSMIRFATGQRLLVFL
ncbi:protein of unknown function [Brevefilum fermentans]|uniref:Uncharacterized protein n=1 Tax=Candidatus Brevifilum fermentans TaxID=1986204 RepID=A0A1Y6K4B2_9CHLR|nr:protein of unknown function [Brevefilum fermentans]